MRFLDNLPNPVSIKSENQVVVFVVIDDRGGDGGDRECGVNSDKFTHIT